MKDSLASIIAGTKETYDILDKNIQTFEYSCRVQEAINTVFDSVYKMNSEGSIHEIGSSGKDASSLVRLLLIHSIKKESSGAWVAKDDLRKVQTGKYLKKEGHSDMPLKIQEALVTIKTRGIMSYPRDIRLAAILKSSELALDNHLAYTAAIKDFNDVLKASNTSRVSRYIRKKQEVSKRVFDDMKPINYIFKSPMVKLLNTAAALSDEKFIDFEEYRLNKIWVFIVRDALYYKLVNHKPKGRVRCYPRKCENIYQMSVLVKELMNLNSQDIHDAGLIDGMRKSMIRMQRAL